MMTLFVLECRHTEGDGAGADPAIVQRREVFGEITASFTDLDRRGSQSSNPCANRGTSKLTRCEFRLAWRQQPHLHPKGSCHQLHRLCSLKWSR